MASSIMVSLASSAAINRAAPPQVSMVAPFIGLRSTAAFPVTHKPSTDLSSLPSNSSRLQCVIIINRSPPGLKKFATLSSIHPLSPRALAKEVDYLLSMGWVPCLELNKIGFVYHENNRSPQSNDEYWTRWKLPMFGCTDSSQVLKELEEAKKAYPNFFIRITGFDNNRQVQCISFIAYKPPSF